MANETDKIEDSTDYGSIVRNNMMRQRNYTGYCGNNLPARDPGGCHNPRTYWDKGQFKCPECGWRSKYPDDFIELYKQRWGIK